MFAVGDNVQVLPPFDFSENTYAIVAIETVADGQQVFFLSGFEGGFSANHLRGVV